MKNYLSTLQDKCFAKMEEFKKSKDITIIFISHVLCQVEKFCNHSIYVNHHQIQYDGNPHTANEKYLKDQKKL